MNLERREEALTDRLRRVPDQLFNSALELAAGGEIAAAEARLETAVSLSPDDVEALTLLGKVKAQQGRLDDAIGIWERVLSRREDYEPAARALSAARRLQRTTRLMRKLSMRGVLASGLSVGGAIAVACVALLLFSWPSRDVAIEAETLIRTSPALSGSVLRVSVRSKVVEITGVVATPQQKELVAALARVAGARSVNLRVSIREPNARAAAGYAVLAALALPDARHVTINERGTELDVEGSVFRPSTRDTIRSALAHVPDVSRVDVTRLLLQPEHHRLVGGENLWKLAQRYYGDGMAWPVIAEANKIEREGQSLVVGTTLLIPPLAEPKGGAK